MKVIAAQGDRVYLLLVGDEMARVLDLDQRKLFPAFNVHSILARGYWEETSIPVKSVLELLERVEIMDDYPPRPGTGTLRVTMYDIDSGDKLAVLESQNGNIRMWENPDPNAMPTVNPGMPEDYFDHMENWTELVPKHMLRRSKVYTPTDGDEFLFSLVDDQPSNIVTFVGHPETWNFEAHDQWREKQRAEWEA